MQDNYNLQYQPSVWYTTYRLRDALAEVFVAGTEMSISARLFRAVYNPLVNNLVGPLTEVLDKQLTAGLRRQE